MFGVHCFVVQVLHRRTKGGGDIFLQFLCETGKNHKRTKLKGKIIINVTLI